MDIYPRLSFKNRVNHNQQQKLSKCNSIQILDLCIYDRHRRYDPPFSQLSIAVTLPCNFSLQELKKTG